MNTSLYAIIVTYNAEQWIAPAIESLLQSTIPMMIVVVDNASCDSTLAIIASSYAGVVVLKMPSNRGFAAANNEGIRHALAQGAEYVFLLNQDARVAPDTITQLLTAMQDHADFGIMSPLHLDYDGQALDSLFSQYILQNQTILSDAVLGQLHRIYNVPFVNAAAWLMSRCLLETVGGFDPIFFMYGEDNDYCARARHHGFKIGITPDARIFHWHGGASRQSSSVKTMTDLLYTQAINSLKRPDRKLIRNLPGFLITWMRKCLHAGIEGDANQCAAVIASLLKVIPDLYLIKSHQDLCRKPGSLWL